MINSLQARYGDLPASPEGLLGRFAPSHLARFARARFALRAHETFREKKSVLRSTQNALKRI